MQDQPQMDPKSAHFIPSLIVAHLLSFHLLRSYLRLISHRQGLRHDEVRVVKWELIAHVVIEIIAEFIYILVIMYL